MSNIICIRYMAYGDGKIIYNGNDLNEGFFDPLYRQIIMITD